MNTEKRRFHPARMILLSCLLMNGATLGIMNNCNGLFNACLRNDLGFRVGDISLLTSITQVVTALTIPFTVVFLKKDKMHLYLAAAYVVACISYGCISFCNGLPLLYFLGAIRGLTGGITGGAAISILINNWFRSKKSLALGIAAASSGLVGAIANPLCSRLIASVGWRTAIWVMAGVCLMITVPFLLAFVRRTPQQMGLCPYETNEKESTKEKAAIRPLLTSSKLVLILCACIAALNSWLTQYIGHLSIYGQSVGLTLEQCAVMTSANMIGIVIMKLLLGAIGDRGGYRSVLNWGFLMAGAAFIVLMLSGGSLLSMCLGTVLFGSTSAISAILPPLMVTYLFGEANYENNLAKIMSGSYIGGTLGMTVIGYMYDFFGSYLPSLILALAMCAGCVGFGIWIQRLSSKKAVA